MQRLQMLVNILGAVMVGGCAITVVLIDYWHRDVAAEIVMSPEMTCALWQVACLCVGWVLGYAKGRHGK